MFSRFCFVLPEFLLGNCTDSFQNVAVWFISCGGGNFAHRMFRGRAVDKGRTAVASPLQLGFPVYNSCGIFLCGVICGIQFTISVLFLWLIVQ